LTDAPLKQRRNRQGGRNLNSNLPAKPAAQTLLLPPSPAQPPKPSVPAVIQARAETSLSPVRRIKWTSPDGNWERWTSRHWPEFPQLARAGAGKYRGVYLSRISVVLAASLFTLCGGIGVLAVNALAEGPTDGAMPRAEAAKAEFAKTLPIVIATAIAPDDVDAAGDDGKWAKQNEDRIERSPARTAAAATPPAKAPPRPETTASIATVADKAEPAKATPAEAAKSSSTRELAQAGNMRSRPNGRTIGVVPKGEEVEVRNCNSWCLVTYKGKQGYVFKSLLRPSDGGKSTWTD
jgi:hypothetical protein